MFLAQLRLWLAKLTSSLIVVLFVVGASSHGSAQSNETAGADINWHKYMQHASTASAIAMALSYVDHCRKKLSILEHEDKDVDSGADVLVLSFICTGGEDEDAGAILTFWGGRKAFEEGPPMLKGFDFAG